MPAPGWLLFNPVAGWRCCCAGSMCFGLGGCLLLSCLFCCCCCCCCC
jgi:hypothetical protein